MKFENNAFPPGGTKKAAAISCHCNYYKTGCENCQNINGKQALYSYNYMKPQANVVITGTMLTNISLYLFCIVIIIDIIVLLTVGIEGNERKEVCYVKENANS
jgi:hypothetical protein